MFAISTAHVPAIGIIDAYPGHGVEEEKTKNDKTIKNKPVTCSGVLKLSFIAMGYRKTNPPASICQALVGKRKYAALLDFAVTNIEKQNAKMVVTKMSTLILCIDRNFLKKTKISG